MHTAYLPIENQRPHTFAVSHGVQQRRLLVWQSGSLPRAPLNFPAEPSACEVLHALFQGA